MSIYWQIYPSFALSIIIVMDKNMLKQMLK